MKMEKKEIVYHLDMILHLIPDHTRIGIYVISDMKKHTLYEGYAKGITKYFPREPHLYEVVNIYQTKFLSFPAIALTVREREL